jgi:DNA repair protein RadC
VAGKSAVDLARELLTQFGSLTQLFAASEADFCAVHGMGQAKYVQLQAIMEMSLRGLKEELQRGDALNSPRVVRDYLQLLLGGRHQEVFLVLFLDTQHRVIASEELFHGTLSQTSVYPREVVKRALAHNAAAVILAHYVARHKMRIMCPDFLCARRKPLWRRLEIVVQDQGT